MKEIKENRLFVYDSVSLCGYFDLFCDPDVSREQKENIFNKVLKKGLDEGKKYEKKYIAIPKKCKNENCVLKTKCINYKFGTGLNWSYDPTKCSNYNKFESIETEEKEYQERRINEFLAENGLEDNSLWSREDEDKIMKFITELKNEIISDIISNNSSHTCEK